MKSPKCSSNNYKIMSNVTKRVVTLFLAVVMCFAFAACGESDKRIKTAQNAINELHKIRSVSDFYDTLYVTENAEIHHNEWSSAYATAIEAYNALSDKEKLDVKNPEWLTENLSYIVEYENVLIEQEIALYCKDKAVEELKDTLVNKSSYEEYGWTLEKVNYSKDNQKFWVDLKIEYSATNKLGGRLDDVDYFDYTGTYKDGKITITG